MEKEGRKKEKDTKAMGKGRVEEMKKRRRERKREEEVKPRWKGGMKEKKRKRKIGGMKCRRDEEE